MKKQTIDTVRNKLKLLSGLLVSLLGLTAGQGQQLAFPGAQGFAQYATGGRGGTVYHVTTLADSGTGSFRDAVSVDNRTIVFDVGGYIVLNSKVSCANNLTIAGQTAPGDGIGIMGHEVSLSAKSNEIIRYLRFRPSSAASSTEDGINCGDGVNMIFDHISIEFAPYNNLDAHGNNGADTITVQNSILGDPTGQQFNAHTEAGGKSFFWAYNLFVSGHNRNPLAKANTIFINNVVYNYEAGYTVADTASSFLQDIVNNYFITGPSTSQAGNDFYQMDSNISAYSAGNLLDQNRDGNLGGSGTSPGGVTVLTSPWSTLTTSTPTFSTTTAYKYDVSMSGDLPHDQVDQVVDSDVLSVGQSGRIYSQAKDDGLGNNGFGTINGGTALQDSDGDGMPDIWETATGSDPNNAADGNTVAADGYTLLEHYLNWLAGPHAITTNASVNVNLSQYTAGFINSPAYTVSGAINGTVSLNGSTATFTANSGFVGLASYNFTVTDSAGSSMTQTIVVLVPGNQYVLNSGFELPGAGKISSGFATIPGWANAGTTYADSGVETAPAPHGGAYSAYCKGGDGGAYQIANYQMNAGDTITLTWWAEHSGGAGTSTQLVSLVGAAALNSAYSSTTVLTSNTNLLNGNGSSAGPWTQYTLNYRATAGDAGKFIGIYFNNATAANWAAFDDFSLTVAPLLPSPWATTDIGAVGVAGNATYTNGLFTVSGSGADIWGAADAFRYVYQSASGDCSIRAKVLSVQNTAPWAKAGVMVRETTNANSTYAMVFLTPVTATSTNGVAFQQRATTGGSASGIATTPGLKAPYWVQLARTGNSFVGSYSANGTNWTAMATNSITMATSVYIGLPVCSVNNSVLNTSSFTNVIAVP